MRSIAAGLAVNTSSQIFAIRPRPPAPGRRGRRGSPAGRLTFGIEEQAALAGDLLGAGLYPGCCSLGICSGRRRSGSPDQPDRSGHSRAQMVKRLRQPIAGQAEVGLQVSPAPLFSTGRGVMAPASIPAVSPISQRTLYPAPWRSASRAADHHQRQHQVVFRRGGSKSWGPASTPTRINSISRD